MGIQELSIKGFRSLRQLSWRPGKLNVVIGPNGSGKSNLLRALELLRRSALGELPQEILRMGGMAPLVWDGQAEELSWTVRVDPIPMYQSLDEDGVPLTYELRLRRLGTTSRYRVDEERLEHSRTDDDAPRSEPFLERTSDHVAVLDTEGRPRVIYEGSILGDDISDVQTLLSLAAGPFGHPVVAGFHDLLSDWSIYHDIPVDPSAPLRQAAVARMDHHVGPDGQNLVPVLHTLYTGDREFKSVIDDAMRVAFDNEYEELVFPPAADQRVQLRVRWRSLRTEQSAADLSDGTIRFLLLLAILANPHPPALIAIDEPEVGLHPSMLPLVAEHAADAAERTQVILTTHSAQLLDAFTATTPTTTVVRSEEGETRLSVIDGEELERWLHEYTLGTLYRSGELEDMA